VYPTDGPYSSRKKPMSIQRSLTTSPSPMRRRGLPLAHH
jgi:hypothetical protein